MTIRSHYVPRFYLENFVPSGKKAIWVFHKKTKQLIPQLPKDTAVIKDLYLASHEKKSGVYSSVESIFSELEGVASSVIDKWLGVPYILDIGDIGKVLPFITYLQCRVPRDMNMTREMLKICLEEAIEFIKENAGNVDILKEHYKKFCKDEKGHNISFEEFVQMSRDPTLGGKFQILPTEDYVKGSSFDKAPEVSKYLMHMGWYLIVAEPGSYYITNDCPLNVFALDRASGKAIFGAGFGLKNIEIRLPLSPMVCLAIDYSGNRGTMRVNAAYVREINRRISFMAEDYIFSSNKTSQNISIMEKFAHVHKYPKIDEKEFRERFRMLLRRKKE